MAYIYEHIRTQGFEPMHFEEHYTRLEELARRLFLAPLTVEREELQRRIGECLRNGGYSSCNTNAVVVRYYATGKIEIEAVEMLYNSFSLRAIRPHGYICPLSGELLLENTSAKEAMLELNRTTAFASEQGVALWVNEQSEILAIDGASVIAIFENEIRFSSVGRGVEFEYAYNIAKSMKRNISREAICVEDLSKVKELFFIDYRGITALEEFGGHRYMDITAEKIATRVAEAERL